MSRLLFIAAVFGLVYWLLKSYRRQDTGTDSPRPTVEDMVRCAECGVHFPRSEGIMAGGKFYCSQEHYRAHANRTE